MYCALHSSCSCLHTSHHSCYIFNTERCDNFWHAYRIFLKQQSYHNATRCPSKTIFASCQWLHLKELCGASWKVTYMKHRASVGFLCWVPNKDACLGMKSVVDGKWPVRMFSIASRPRADALGEGSMFVMNPAHNARDWAAVILLN